MDKEDPFEMLAKIMHLLSNASAGAAMSGNAVEIHDKIYVAPPPGADVAELRKQIGQSSGKKVVVMDYENALEDHTEKYAIGEQFGEFLQEIGLTGRKINLSYTPVAFICHVNVKLEEEALEAIENKLLDILEDYRGRLRLILVAGKDVKIFTDLGAGTVKPELVEAVRKDDGREMSDPIRERTKKITEDNMTDIRIALNLPDVLDVIRALERVG